MANLTLPLLGAPVTLVDINGNVITFPQSSISGNGGTLTFDANGNLVLTEPATFGFQATGTVPGSQAGAGTDSGVFITFTAPAGGPSSGAAGGDGADMQFTTGAAGASISGGANGGDFSITLGPGSGTGRAGQFQVSGGLIVANAGIQNTGTFSTAGGIVGINNTGGNAINIGATSWSGTLTIGNAASSNMTIQSGAKLTLTAVGGVLHAHTPVAMNATATMSAAQFGSGYITSTSAAATSLTLPTATTAGTAVGAVQGTVHWLYIDNTAGANTVTIVLNTGIVASALAVAAATTFGLLTVPSGTTGQACFKIMFSSATAATITRVA